MRRTLTAREEATEAIAAAEEDYRLAIELKPNDDLRFALLTNRGLMSAPVEPPGRCSCRPGSGHPAQAEPVPGSRHAGPGLRRGGGQEDRRGVLHSGDRLPSATDRGGRALPQPRFIYAYRGDITPCQHDAALREVAEAISQEPDKFLKVRDHVDRAKLFFAVRESRQHCCLRRRPGGRCPTTSLISVISRP